VVIVYGTGTVIARQAHVHRRHPGSFEACMRCNGFLWLPRTDPGVLVSAGDGRLVEVSETVRRLLRP
jgi:hypothetical protein